MSYTLNESCLQIVCVYKRLVQSVLLRRSGAQTGEDTTAGETASTESTEHMQASSTNVRGHCTVQYVCVFMETLALRHICSLHVSLRILYASVHVYLCVVYAHE